MAAEDEAAIREALASEDLHLRLPSLRAAVRSTIERVKSRYAERRKTFVEGAQAARNSLEAMPEWLLISPEDRAEIAGRLDGSQLPEAPEAGRETAQLRLLLARDSGLGSLAAELQSEVCRRVPAPPPVPEPPHPNRRSRSKWMLPICPCRM